MYWYCGIFMVSCHIWYRDNFIDPSLEKFTIPCRVFATCATWHLFLVSHFSFLLLPTVSPLMKLWQFWPFQSPPDHPKCYLTAKSSPQPSIHIFRKSQKKLATFPIDFFRGMAKVWEGGHFTPPPASDRVKDCCEKSAAPEGLPPPTQQSAELGD